MKTYFFACFAVGILSLFSCVQAQVARNLDQKIQKNTLTRSGVDLELKAESAIRSNQNLSEEQRSRLLDLQQSSQVRLDRTEEKSLKLREQLITDMNEPRYNKKEVALIRKRLVQVEKQRVDLVLVTLDEANAIMDR